MKPLITTVSALREVATGLALEAIPTSPVLFAWSSPNADYLLTPNDSLEDQRIAVLREQFQDDRFVPDHLAPHRRETVSRMVSFAERAKTAGTLTLPRAWHQYKHRNLIAFFAVPSGDSAATRWVAEVVPGPRADVVFLDTTTSGNKTSLEDFWATGWSNPLSDSEWELALQAAKQQFVETPDTHGDDVEIALPQLRPSATKGWSYQEWLKVVSDDQLAFIDAPTDKAIRLRGPAGSGKTLALTLKAVREALRARDLGEDVRILIVTHSWSLATEISDSLDSLGFGAFREIEVFPLLELGSAVSLASDGSGGQYKVIGSDSFSGKLAQLHEILELLSEFADGDWLTYRTQVSPEFRARLDSQSREERMALAWDLLLEFGSVIGAAGIFPGAGSESRYFGLERATWMMPLSMRQDQRVVFELYGRYMAGLDERGLWTSDQVLADLLNDLQKHSWNRARREEGYDLIFVDEFHLFNPLERQVLHHLSRDVSRYPRIFMALDPRQSPSEAFIGLAADETRSGGVGEANEFGDVESFELTSVHRYTPEVLRLVKHVHFEFPTLDLGNEWNVDFSAVESAREGGGLMPRLVTSASRSGEEDDIARAVFDRYQSGTMALAVVDTRQWRRFSELAARINGSPKFHVATIAGRSDLEGLGYRKRGLVVGLAEYLAGLQFDTVFVAGLPDLEYTARAPSEQTRLLSLLYLALSRAEDEIRVFVNDDDGGAPEVFQRAVANGLMTREQGSLV